MAAKPVKGLSGRQWRALSKALSFDRDKRTATVSEFLDGMTGGDKLPWWMIVLATLALAAAVGLAVWKFAPQPTIQTSREDQARNERDAMAMLAQVPADAKSPADLVDKATDIRLRLTDRRLLQFPAVKAKLDGLVEGYLKQSQQALSRGDSKLADDYLSVAEALNSDTALEGKLRQARQAIKSAPKPSAPQTDEQRLTDLIAGLDRLEVRLSKPAYRKNDPIRLEIEMPRAATLHVFGVQPGENPVLLFPNKLSPDSKVQAGTTAIDNLVALPPYGTQWIVAVLDPDPINLYQQFGRDKAKLDQGLVTMSDSELLDFLRGYANNTQALLGHARMTVCSASGVCE